MSTPTETQPTDTIRDAFEAMLRLLACLFGEVTMHATLRGTPAEEIGAAAADELNLDGYYEDTHAGLLALRDLIQRAAEEHNRRALDDWHAREQAKLGRANWTPERLREARERCERATPGPWTSRETDTKRSWREIAGTRRPVIEASGFTRTRDGESEEIYGVWMRAEDAAFIAHAREDLPAALAEIERQARAAIVLTADAAALRSELAAAREEIERLNRLVVATANADPSWVERCTTQAAEIERLTAELAARAPATPTERTFPRVTLGSVAPGSLIEIASGDIGLVLDGCYGEAPRYVAWVATGHVDTMPADATVSLRATPAELDALTSADATEAQDEIVAALKALGARPDLTLGEAIARFKARRASSPGLSEEQADAIATDIERALPEGGRLSRSDFTAAIKGAILRASRGETGPAPTWGEQAIEEHRRAADGITRVRVIEPPASPFGEWPEPERSGLTCPGCYAATGIATPCKGPLLSPAEQADPSFADALLVAQDRHREAAAVHPTTETDRQRSTLHAGDPAAVQYCACGAAVSPGEDHPTGPRHDVARRPQ